MTIRREDWGGMCTLALMSAPAIAFMTFDFVFPNISAPSLGKNMFAAFLVSALAAMPSGYLLRKTDVAIVTVMVYTFLGYVLAIVAYAGPFLFFDFSVIFPGLYILFFLNTTIIPFLIFMVGGFMGVVFGQILWESAEKGETAQAFSRGRG
jgi:hypothetical protein